MDKPVKTFEDYWEIVTSNDIWYDRIKIQYARKSIKRIAEEAFIDLLTQPARIKAADPSDFQKHLSKFLMYAKDEITKPQLQQITIEDKPKHSEPILTGEARQKYIKQWLEAVKNVDQKASLVPRLTHKQMADEGDWLPPKDKPWPSTSPEYLIQSEIHDQYGRENYNPITGKPNINWKPEQQWMKDNEKEIKEWLNNLNK